MSAPRRLALAAALAATAVAAAAAAQPPAAARPPASDAPAWPSRVQAGIRVVPDTVTVGDPFTIIVRVRVPDGARIEWPVVTDSAADIAPRAPMGRRDGARGDGWREEIAEFPVAAWDTGTVATTWPPARVIVGADTVPVGLADARVHVRSVLSADTAQHVPRPAKLPFAREVPWWERWWPALLALAVLLAVLWWRRRRVRRPALPPPARLPGAHERAAAAFDRLERLALADAGEHGRAVTLALEILRHYLGARLPHTSPAQTSAEVLAAVAEDTRVPVSDLVQFLVAADAVKYARRPLDAAEAGRLVRGARAIVDEVERRDLERRASASAASASAASASAGERGVVAGQGAPERAGVA